ncbi:23S rRNA (uracil(1939)-C(5))-methyltransferase RlmD [Thalassotalea sp. LPB0316]|uniref:23S rRNA (uracil(1939)-C(5))-methyltransferase RlmD n=1 Tax=Thalassotalea sp. LPB0316 TaxID=2769490 RepID=UPI001866C0B7|nr:23S rRNA (uracil(1939)-C(5))-methyltransferase RlmD [Thalassotalea sp. LPB0316]QOL25569.1 23S rRNA (uracil(1939)-C(5))-methyltransferase RlmD [Thalassotalea sp. LPB0316]
MVKIFKPTANKALKGKNLTLTIERLDFNGRGVARYQNKPIFISGALAQEQVKVRIIEQSSKYCVGQLLDVIKPSDVRSAPKCPHYKVCGGCDMQHIDESQHVEIKQAKVTELFARQKLLDLPWQDALVDSQWHYRRKARLGVQYHKNGNAVVGFREKHTNNVTPIKQCDVLLKPLSKLLPELVATVNQLPAKSIGHIELVYTERQPAQQNQPIITLVIRQLGKLTEAVKERWQVFCQQASNNSTFQVYFDFGQEKPLEPLNQVEGLSYLVDSDIEIAFEPSNFIQVHHQVNQQMISHAIDWLSLSEQDKVLDLYCGLGNFSLPLAKRVASVTGIEGVQAMVDKAANNASVNNLSNCQFYQANLNANWQSGAWLEQSYNKILLDPARAGALEACQQLGRFNATDIVYVSCDPATLARDSAVLVAQGYQIKKIALMEMFGQTKHVETMVLFQR